VNIHPILARPALVAFALAALSFIAAPSARAEKADREKPINYSADTGDVNYQTKIGALSGNVIITQGTLSIRADRITFRQNGDNSMSATAYGNPVSVRQKRDGFDEYYEAYAQRVEYDGSKEFVELFDRALLRRGQDEIRSNYISYNAATEVFKAEGRVDTATTPDAAGPGPRVRGVFQPKSDTSFVPGKGKDAAKSGGTAADAKAPAENPPAALKPAGELAPNAPK
jgi:lipopolysaccharide export system protein LptA